MRSLTAFAFVVLLILAMPMMANNQVMIRSAESAPSQPEALTQYDVPVSRSFSHPVLWFDGEPDTFMTQTITWYPNGTTNLTDDMGSSFNFSIDTSDGALASLHANSQFVDQKVVGNGFNYIIHWKPVKSIDGSIYQYKFDIVGTSENGRTIKFPVQTTEDKIKVENNRIIGISDSYNLNSTIPQGIGIDWSDAVSQGNNMRFDHSSRAILLSVGPSFSVDPVTVDTISVALSPSSTDYYEGEKRLVKIGSTLFVFYYDGLNISYKYSTNNGNTWSAKTSLGTGTINSDYYRYTVISSTYSAVNRVTLLYWKQSSTNTDFYAKTYTVSGSSLTLFSTDVLFTIANHSACSSGTCAAAVGEADTSGNIYAAFRYLKSGLGTYYYRIVKSTDGGNTWSTSLAESSSGSSTRIEMAITKLSSARMLFAYAKYSSSELIYRTFSGSSWSAETTTSGAGMTANTVKQISATSDGLNQGYVAYLTGGTSGTLKVAKFTSTGSFSAFQTVDSTRSHKLPSGALSSINTGRYVHFFTIVSGEVYDSRIVPNGSWHTWRPAIGFSSANQLASSINYRGYVWMEGSNIRFTIDDPPHDEGEAGLYLWSRLTADGHRVELSCQSAPNDDRCKIPYYIDSSVTQTGLSVATVSSEAALAAGRLNAMTVYIGVQELAQTSFWDNAIKADNLLPGEVGSYSGSPIRHCTNPPFCTAFDSHNIKWTLKINGNPAEINFETFETCAGFGSTPTAWDIDKTLGHELFHMLSFDHANGQDPHSIVAFNGYYCTTGVTPVEQDVDVAQKKYPAGVK